MVATPYKTITFDDGDVITLDTLDQMQSNLQWIKDNSPRSRTFLSDDTWMSTRTVILAGKVKINPNKKSDTGKAIVHLPPLFDPACTPMVTTGIIATWTRKIHCTVTGLGAASLPSAAGFEVYANVGLENMKAKKVADRKKNDKLKKPVWISWIAYGYRSTNG